MPSKVLAARVVFRAKYFTAKHLTVLGLFEMALSKRRAKKKKKSTCDAFMNKLNLGLVLVVG